MWLINLFFGFRIRELLFETQLNQEPFTLSPKGGRSRQPSSGRIDSFESASWYKLGVSVPVSISGDSRFSRT